MKRVLDLACGPGKWAIDVGFTYRHLEVDAVDLSGTMIRYASALAISQRLDNVSFEITDITRPLPFEANTFDLVNARCVAGVLTPSSWLAMLTECRRILRPGGIMRITEIELAVSNSAALQRLSEYLYTAFQKEGKTFSVDGHTFGIVHMLGRLLQQTHFHTINKRSFVLDGTCGEPWYYPFCQEVEVTFTLLKPYLLGSGVLIEEIFESLYQTILMDIRMPDFTCLSYGLTAWGRK